MKINKFVCIFISLLIVNSFAE